MNNKAILHLSKDPLIQKVIASVTLPELTKNQETYVSLIRAIVSQQLSTKAAATIYGRFLDLFHNKYPDLEVLLETDLEVLRSVGLSKQKSGYLKNVAEFALKEKWEKLDWSKFNDEEAIKYLTQIKGVGTWTAQMILMFTLNREDIFPVGDLGIQQAMIKLYGIKETGKELLKRMKVTASAWSPYRTIACRYLWQWKDR